MKRFLVQVICAWYHAMGFVIYYLRFLELERRGAFDKGVRACVVYRAACPDNKFRDAGHLLHSSAYEFTKKFYAEVLKLPVGE